jgi:integrase
LGGLKAKDVVWKKGLKEYSVWLRRSKCNRSGDGEWITCRCYGGLNSVVLLRRYMEDMDLLRNPDALLFPTRRGKQWVRSATISASWLRNVIKALAESRGLDKRYYSAHSLRAGGATDLFVARVPYFAIKNMGRWKSDSAMLYYRCEEDVCKAVAEAFSEISEFY